MAHIIFPSLQVLDFVILCQKQTNKPVSKGTRKNDVNSVYPKNNSFPLFLRLLVRGPSQSNVVRFILPLASDLLKAETEFSLQQGLGSEHW